MSLQSQLFRGDPKLEAAAVSDPAHIMPGTGGDHVRKIQLALIQLNGAAITADGVYGPATAAAVLAFKQKRNIINRSYQTKADNIVGKMTIAALDREMLAKETPTPGNRVCVLDSACPCDRGQTRGIQLNFAFDASIGGRPDDDAALRIQLALLDSRQTLREAIGKLNSARQVMVRSNLPFSKPLTAEEQKILNSAAKWLNLTLSNRIMTLIHLAAAVSLMQRNLTIKNSKGQSPETKRVTETFHASVDGNPDNGIQLGIPFFGQDGRNCRRDVITHEFFHFLGVHHGGGALGGPTIRSAITTPAQALDSADNLAQLVAELTTPSGNTDACARPGE
ncbi:MAG: peptidoglycan-binding protein [Candidatus Competibacteraceae bacterium]|nr:peptidoglycan-binding protein [Candidatus Competibacteraceae bacterium]